jgi:hypothetical protein
MEYYNFLKIAYSEGNHNHAPGQDCMHCNAIGHLISELYMRIRHPGAATGNNPLDRLRRAIPTTRSDNRLTSERSIGNDFTGPINLDLGIIRQLDENRLSLLPDETPEELTTWMIDEPKD